MTTTICLIGLNHTTAPLDVRERLALTGDGLRQALKAIQKVDPALCEAAILSTCNRFEVYLVAADQADARRGFDAFMQDFFGIVPGALGKFLYEMRGDQATRHLMRVTAGLESMVLGEPQIQGQVAQVLSKARSTGAAGVLLNRLFEAALHAGKRARTETEIGHYTTSVSHAAARLANEKLDGLARANVLIVGAGEMAAHAAAALHRYGIGSLTCISRSVSHARQLADQVGGEAANWLHLPEALARADLVISATSAPHVVLRPANVAQILPERGSRPLLIVDIAVPRDVDEAVADLPGVDLYDIDDLQSVVDTNLSKRKAAIPNVEAIIEQELAAFRTWLRNREAVPAIADLRRRADEIAGAELEKTLKALNGAPPGTEEAITALAHGIVNKLLHSPTTSLKAHAQAGDSAAYADMVRELFALDSGSEETTDD